MSLKAGIVGLPNVGKSTLFNAITKKHILAANYPFATIDPNVGVVTVPDSRLTFLENVAILYKDSSLSGKLFGIGRTTLLNTKDVEIDIFDIFFSIGMVGFIIYLCYFGYVLTEVKIKGLPKFIFILLLVISLFSGHVLISPMVSTYLAMLFGIKNGRN